MSENLPPTQQRYSPITRPKRVDRFHRDRMRSLIFFMALGCDYDKEVSMGLEISGIAGLLILIADIWAIVSTFQSPASTGKKVLWIVLVLVLPVIGFVLWLLAGPKSK